MTSVDWLNSGLAGMAAGGAIMSGISVTTVGWMASLQADTIAKKPPIEQEKPEIAPIGAERFVYAPVRGGPSDPDLASGRQGQAGGADGP